MPPDQDKYIYIFIPTHHISSCICLTQSEKNMFTPHTSYLQIKYRTYQQAKNRHFCNCNELLNAIFNDQFIPSQNSMYIRLKDFGFVVMEIMVYSDSLLIKNFSFFLVVSCSFGCTNMTDTKNSFQKLSLLTLISKPL